MFTIKKSLAYKTNMRSIQGIGQELLLQAFEELKRYSLNMAVRCEVRQDLSNNQ